MVPSARRIIALWFPRLSTDRLYRCWRKSPPPDVKLPLVLVAKTENAMRLTAVDRRAADLGLEAGMALASARAMVPALKVMPANEPADTKLLVRLADWCVDFSPFVAFDPPQGLFLDVTGTSHLFGGEAAMLEHLRAALKKQGFTARTAMAGSAMAARALARYRAGLIVPPGDDGDAMAGLPVEALALDVATTHAFRRAGLKTVGKVASRTRVELTARFGAAMVSRLDAALGMAETPISPRMPLPSYRVDHRFAEPVTVEGVLLTTLEQLAGEISQMLEVRGEGARGLEAVFFRADGNIRRIVVETGGPTRDPDILARLFRERLDALADPLDPGFGFDLIRLQVIRSEPYRSEDGDLDSKADEEKEIRYLIDRLSARFGSHRVLRFRPNDTHIPERAYSAVPAQYAEKPHLPWKRKCSGTEAPRRPLRLFSPEPVHLLQGETLLFRWRSAVRVVRKLEGPERIAMEWWRVPGPDRDYFRMEDEEGRRYWLYREAGSHWFLHGVFA